jgi:hypothetical protein
MTYFRIFLKQEHKVRKNFKYVTFSANKQNAQLIQIIHKLHLFFFSALGLRGGLWPVLLVGNP